MNNDERESLQFGSITSIYHLYPTHVPSIFESRGIPFVKEQVEIRDEYLDPSTWGASTWSPSYSKKGIPPESRKRLIDPEKLAWGQLGLGTVMVSHRSLESDVAHVTREFAAGEIPDREIVEVDDSWKKDVLTVSGRRASFYVVTTPVTALRSCIKQQVFSDAEDVKGGTLLPRRGKEVLNHYLLPNIAQLCGDAAEAPAGLRSDHRDHASARVASNFRLYRQVVRLLEVCGAGREEAERDFERLVGSTALAPRFYRVDVELPLDCADPGEAIEWVSRGFMQVFPLTVATRRGGTGELALEARLGKTVGVKLAPVGRRLTFTVTLHAEHPALLLLSTLLSNPEVPAVEYQGVIETAVAPYVYGLWKAQERALVGPPPPEAIEALRRACEAAMGGHKANPVRRGTLLSRLLVDLIVPRADGIKTREKDSLGGLGPFKDAEFDHLRELGLTEQIAGSEDGRHEVVRLRDPHLLIAASAGRAIAAEVITPVLQEAQMEADLVPSIDDPIGFKDAVLDALTEGSLTFPEIERTILRELRDLPRLRTLRRRIDARSRAALAKHRAKESGLPVGDDAGQRLATENKESWRELDLEVNHRRHRQEIFRLRLGVVVSNLVLQRVVHYDIRRKTLALAPASARHSAPDRHAVPLAAPKSSESHRRGTRRSA